MPKPKKKPIQQTTPQVFSFGDPEGILESNYLADYLEVFDNGNFYEPNITPDKFLKLLSASTYHASSLEAKTNIVASTFKANQILNEEEFYKIVYDFLVFGNAYLEIIKNSFDEIVSLAHIPALYTRITKTGDFVQVDSQGYSVTYEFPKNSVIHLKEYDPKQEIYGTPKYLAGLNSLLLDEAATLFRRKYYKNGAHMGFILSYSGSSMNADLQKNLAKAVQDAKGVGNFRNLFVNIPNSKPEDLKLMPVGEVVARDNFEKIKKVATADILAAHRIPPAIMCIVPEGTSGFGDIAKATQVFARNEISPIQTKIKRINKSLGFELIKFTEYDLGDFDKT